jgi:tRNA(adenine34) deaminase
MKNDENFMRRCLELGRKAMETGDAPVGSVIVAGEKIIAEGIEAVKSKYDPTAHAEIEAVRAACEKLNSLDLSGATLYTNVEPCVMCSFAIRQTGIRRVVFGISNNQVGGANSKFAVLTDPEFPAKFAPPEIRAGVLIVDCKNLFRDFQQINRNRYEINNNFAGQKNYKKR